MSREERDNQIEDQVDFTQDQSEEQGDLTPEINNFDQIDNQEGTLETPMDSTKHLEFQTPAQTEIDTQLEIPQETASMETPKDLIEQPQETPSPGRVMRFDDFVSNLN
jgi:hypothetical protein